MLDKQYPKDPVDSAVEEMAELTKELMKAHRFGLYNHHPDTPDELNIDRIRAEMIDVRNAFDELEKWLHEEEHNAFNQT